MQNSKTVLITGASGTIGSSIANTLANEGFSLILHYRSNREILDQLKHTYRDKDIEIVIVQEDLSTFEGIRRLNAKIEEYQLSPSILINSLGVASYGLIQDVTFDDWQQLVNVNMMSYFFCSQLAIPHMVKNKYGRIINISSIWGTQGAANEAAYSMTKGAINTLTRALAKELAPSGITVNAIAPGVVMSKMMESFTQEELAQLKSEIPINRFLRPEEIAFQVLHLINDNSSYITGQIITMDGGWT